MDNRDELLQRYKKALRKLGRSKGYIEEQLITGKDVDLDLLRKVTELAERSVQQLSG